MSTQLSFIAVRESKDVCFSQEELDIIKSTIREYFSKNIFSKKDAILDVIEIHSEAFKTKVEDNTYFDVWYETLQTDIKDKIFEIAKYKSNFWIDLSTGKIMDKVSAERCFPTTSAREIVESLLEAQMSVRLFDVFSWYKLKSEEVLNLSKTFTYIKSGLKTGRWNTDEEYNLGCFDFVNNLGMGIYGYDAWQNRHIDMSMDVDVYTPGKDGDRSIASLIRLIRDIWTENTKQSKQTDTEDEYYCESDIIDPDERFRYLNIVDDMSSFFREVYRLMNETKEYAIEDSADIIKVLVTVG